MVSRHVWDAHPLRRVPVVSVLTAPDPIITAQEMNARLRLDLSFDSPIPAEDQVVIDDLEAIIEAATASLDGPSGTIGRALGPQTLCLSVETCGERFIQLPYPPVIAVDAIEYDDSNGAIHAVDASTYRLRRGAVYFASGAPDADDLRITFRAGYASADSPDVATVPANIKHAIRLLIGDMWAFRETATLGQANEIPMSATVKNLIAPFKVYAV